MNKKELWLINHRVNSDGVIERLCKNCGEWKEESLEYFYLKNKTYPERGYVGRCRPCSSKKSYQWILDNPDKFKEINNRAYKKPKRKADIAEANLEYVKNGGRKLWEDANKEKINVYSKERWHNKKHDISPKDWIRCKLYFNNSCAYCELHINNHYRKYAGKLKKIDLHREHVDHNGSNRIDNCIPSCMKCNTSKHDLEFLDWYDTENKRFTLERLHRILQWLEFDYKSQ